MTRLLAHRLNKQKLKSLNRWSQATLRGSILAAEKERQAEQRRLGARQLHCVKMAQLARNLEAKAALRALYKWITVARADDLAHSEVNQELGRKLNLKVSHQKQDLHQQLTNKYRERRKCNAILHKIQGATQGGSENVLEESQPSLAMLQAGSQSPAIPANLSLNDVEFLGNNQKQGLKIPPSIKSVVDMYMQNQQKIQHIQRGRQLETTIKQMCYDMMIEVLAEHQRKAQPGFRPKPLKLKSRSNPPRQLPGQSHTLGSSVAKATSTVIESHEVTQFNAFGSSFQLSSEKKMAGRPAGREPRLELVRMEGAEVAQDIPTGVQRLQ